MLAAIVIGWIAVLGVPGPQAAAETSALSAAVDALGVFDLNQRTVAARALRRAAPEAAVPLLERAARQHRDSYTRFRAFVLLTGFNQPSTATLARDLLGDRDDRVRTAAYQWFEYHRDPRVLPVLLDALPRETSEFVRPALTRTLAAYGDDTRVRQGLVPLVTRGEDLFRASVIDAIGSYAGEYAVTEIAGVARLDGPLQDDAIAALGRIGGADARAVLVALQASAPRDTQPGISAALCLVGVDCEGREAFLKETLAFAAATDGYRSLLRGATQGLGLLAGAGRRSALEALFAVAVASRDAQVQESLALAVGRVALRAPLTLLDALETRAVPGVLVSLVLDAFDMLSEDVAEEQFYVEIRRAYWAAPDQSARRGAAEALIQGLEF